MGETNFIVPALSSIDGSFACLVNVLAQSAIPAVGIGNAWKASPNEGPQGSFPSE